LAVWTSFCFLGATSFAEDQPAGLLQTIRMVAREGAGSPAARAAWNQLVTRGPGVLPPILDAMDTSDTVVANWLRTAFDHIVDQELKTGGRRIDADKLLVFVRDPKRQGRARRLALEVVDRLRPGTGSRLLSGWLEDPEFRHEAVAAVMKEADSLQGQGKKDE